MSFALLGGTFEGMGIAARGYLNVNGKKDIVLFLIILPTRLVSSSAILTPASQIKPKF